MGPRFRVSSEKLEKPGIEPTTPGLRALGLGQEMTLAFIGNPNFCNRFKRIVNRFKRAGYTSDIMRQTACLVFNPIMVEGYAALFGCTAVIQASESMTASM